MRWATSGPLALRATRDARTNCDASRAGHGRTRPTLRNSSTRHDLGRLLHAPAHLRAAGLALRSRRMRPPPGGIEWIPASDYYTQADNALVAEWYGRVWMNPPFSNPGPFVKRFTEHGDGVAIVPSSNGKWLTDLWNSNVSWHLPEPIHFHKATTGAACTASIPTRCWLVAAGPTCKAALRKFGRVR